MSTDFGPTRLSIVDEHKQDEQEVIKAIKKGYNTTLKIKNYLITIENPERVVWRLIDRGIILFTEDRKLAVNNQESGIENDLVNILEEQQEKK